MNNFLSIFELLKSEQSPGVRLTLILWVVFLSWFTIFVIDCLYESTVSELIENLNISENRRSLLENELGAIPVNSVGVHGIKYNKNRREKVMPLNDRETRKESLITLIGSVDSLRGLLAKEKIYLKYNHLHPCEFEIYWFYKINKHKLFYNMKDVIVGANPLGVSFISKYKPSIGYAMLSEEEEDDAIIIYGVSNEEEKSNEVSVSKIINSYIEYNYLVFDLELNPNMVHDVKDYIDSMKLYCQNFDE